MGAADAAPEARLVSRLRAAGCVFAEKEAEVLRERADGDPALLERLLRRRIEGEPLEPLVGWVDFGALRLSVVPGVFVPRQRSLQLAEAAVEALRRAAARVGRRPVFLEAFAGVAPIAATVQGAWPGCRVLASERDRRARRAARENLGPGASVFAGDVLRGVPRRWQGAVDVIAAVPPYVPSGEVGVLPREAREHEPIDTLTAGTDGLDRIRELISQSTAWLAPNGCLLLEMHRSQCDEASRFGERLGLSASFSEGRDGQSGVLVLRERALRAV